MGFRPVILLTDPILVKDYFMEKFKNYEKMEFLLNSVKNMNGDGLFVVKYD